MTFPSHPLLEYLLPKYRSRGIIVDTGPLLLYYVGATSERLIGTHKRTATFKVEDFRTLVELLGQFRHRFTTPQVMAEVCNLADAISGKLGDRFFDFVVRDLKGVEEIYHPSFELCHAGYPPSLGFADLSMLAAARQGRLVLSTDAPLCEWCRRSGLDALNFNYLRTL